MQETIKIDKAHVEKQIKDWKKRISSLYSTLQDWLKGTKYTLKSGAKVTMYEEPMSLVDIKSTEVDTVDIYRGNRIVLSFKPRGLWVIGTNGRIDIISLKKGYILVDVSNQFKPPHWKLFNGESTNGNEFKKQLFFQLLRNS